MHDMLAISCTVDLMLSKQQISSTSKGIATSMTLSGKVEILLWSEPETSHDISWTANADLIGCARVDHMLHVGQGNRALSTVCCQHHPPPSCNPRPLDRLQSLIYIHTGVQGKHIQCICSCKLCWDLMLVLCWGVSCTPCWSACAVLQEVVLEQ